MISGRVALQRPGVRLAARPLDGASVLEMDPDQLFLKTLSDLERRTGSEASEYDVLRSSALLRQLLLDGSPLVHQVNRHRRLTLVFRVNVASRRGGERGATRLHSGHDTTASIQRRRW